jgi:hypothetical protein
MKAATGLTAAAAVFRQAIGLGSDYAKATSEKRLSDYERYDILGLAGLLKDGTVSPSELLEAAIERVEQRNPTINAVVDRMLKPWAESSCPFGARSNRLPKRYSKSTSF